MSPWELSQFSTHVPVEVAALLLDAAGSVVPGSVPVTVIRLSESAQMAPVSPARQAFCVPFTHSLSRPASSEYRVVLLVPSLISVTRVGPFCRSAPLLPSPP